jgi:hypothetical protein
LFLILIWKLFSKSWRTSIHASRDRQTEKDKGFKEEEEEEEEEVQVLLKLQNLGTKKQYTGLQKQQQVRKH